MFKVYHSFSNVCQRVGYGFVADKSAGFVRRKPKIVNLRGLSARKVRSNEL